MEASLSELRIRLDQVTEQIVSGLKNRSRFLLNEGVFTEEFAHGMTWIMYRLKAEQDVDATFGRYLYLDQHPFLYKKEELAAPIAKRLVPDFGVKNIRFDFSKEIISTYLEVLREICAAGEEVDNYGAVAKLDVDNLLLFNERVLGFGEQVAEQKKSHGEEALCSGSEEEVRRCLQNLSREKEVIENTVSIAKRYGIKNPGAVGNFMKKLIELTTEAEVGYILESEKRKN